jgi:hypothetical protein
MKASGKLHTPAALPGGKEPQYLLDRRLGGPQRRSKMQITLVLGFFMLNANSS